MKPNKYTLLHIQLDLKQHAKYEALHIKHSIRANKSTGKFRSENHYMYTLYSICVTIVETFFDRAPRLKSLFYTREIHTALM